MFLDMAQGLPNGGFAITRDCFSAQDGPQLTVPVPKCSRTSPGGWIQINSEVEMEIECIGSSSDSIYVASKDVGNPIVLHAQVVT